MKKIMVTGGNSGIGLALCTSLVEAGHRVFLGSRDPSRGAAAVANIGHPLCTLLVLDVASDDSVRAAATQLREALGGDTLYGLVNNAGVGLMHPDVSLHDIIDVNLFGAKRVTEAFLPMIQSGGRIANTSSGAASSYIAGVMQGKPMGRATADQKRPLIDPDVTWEQIAAIVNLEEAGGFTMSPSGEGAGWCAYALSKAALTAYAMLLARTNPHLMVSSCTPGFINTKMTAGWGASLEPKEGIQSLEHCLFGALGGSGWYFGSDAVRSPLHYMRSPGEPAYDGSPGAPGEPAW